MTAIASVRSVRSAVSVWSAALHFGCLPGATGACLV